VATIANIAAHLGSLGWNGGWSETTWTVMAITLATALGIFMIYRRNMLVFGGVVIWALIAIAVRHWGVKPDLEWSAMIGSMVIGVGMVTHAYINRSSLPLVKGSNRASINP